jgi:hypothetical protein
MSLSIYYHKQEITLEGLKACFLKKRKGTINHLSHIRAPEKGLKACF